MFNCSDLANAVHEEALAIPGYAYPLPDPNKLALVLEELFWSSLLAEEGRPCRPRLLYMPSADRSRHVHWFQEDASLDRETLRKLAPAHGPLGYLLWKYEHERPLIFGIEPRQGGDPPDLIVAASNTGALDITYNTVRIVATRAGQVYRLSSALTEPDVLLRQVRKILGGFDIVLLNSVMHAILHQGHGGSIWIVRDGCSVDGLNIGRRTVPDSRPLIERFPRLEDRRPWLTSIAMLAAVDGAVVIDACARTLGFAAFIELGAPVNVLRQLPGGESDEIVSSALGGGRHRSAVEFCSRFAPAAAIVISEDGRTSVIASSGSDDMPWCAEVAFLGYHYW